MHSERVTFLESPDHKAALDAFAARNGVSVGRVLREASRGYIAGRQGPDGKDEYEDALALILPELEAALPRMLEDVVAMRRSVSQAREAIDRALAGEDA